jgi:hypothetical protein
VLAKVCDGVWATTLGWLFILREGHAAGWVYQSDHTPRPGLEETPSRMGTPEEDESIFAILVAGDTPSNLHQDKLGEYIR